MREFVCSCGWRKEWDWSSEAEEHMRAHAQERTRMYETEGVLLDRSVWWVEIAGQPTDRKPKITPP